MSDIFDTGTPKYQSPQSIYDGLRELVHGEEISLLSDIFPDVSWERQGYYYQDNGDRLKEKFEKLSDYGDKMWLFEIAVWQLDNGDVNDLIFEALINPDFAKRIGLKKLFVEKLLKGDARDYKAIITEFEDAVRELDRFDRFNMAAAFADVMKPRGRDFIHESPYQTYYTFVWHFCEKAGRIDVRNEVMLVSECRTFLTSYDDFMFGLKVNQALHESLFKAHGASMAKLQSDYDQKVKVLLAAAEKFGLLPEIEREIDLVLPPSPFLLEVKDAQGFQNLTVVE